MKPIKNFTKYKVIITFTYEGLLTNIVNHTEEILKYTKYELDIEKIEKGLVENETNKN